MKFSFSLYFQITVLFVLISIFSVVGAGTLNYLESRRIIVAQFNKSMKDIATTIGSTLNDKTDDAAEAILRISGHDIFLSGQPGDIQKFLQVAVESSGLFNNIYYFDAAGPLKAAAYADGRDLTRYHGENFNNYRDQEKTKMVYLDLLRALETKTPVFSAFFKSTHDRLMNSFIVPVMRGHEVAGLLSCGIVLDRTNKLLKMMQELKPHPHGYIALLSQDGKMLINAGELPQNFSPGKDWHVFEDSLIHDAGYIQVVLHMEKPGLGICIGLPESAVRAILDRLRSGTLSFTVGVGFLASFFGILAAWILISPLSALVNGLRQLRLGRPGDEIDCRASGEIAEAISVYNDLSDKIRRDSQMTAMWAALWKNDSEK